MAFLRNSNDTNLQWTLALKRMAWDEGNGSSKCKSSRRSSRKKKEDIFSLRQAELSIVQLPTQDIKRYMKPFTRQLQGHVAQICRLVPLQLCISTQVIFGVYRLAPVSWAMNAAPNCILFPEDDLWGIYCVTVLPVSSRSGRFCLLKQHCTWAFQCDIVRLLYSQVS